VGHAAPALESVVVSAWRSRRVLVTGHTGFKGAWLSLWLTAEGAAVTGLAYPPATEPSLFGLLANVTPPPNLPPLPPLGGEGVKANLTHRLGDVRDAGEVLLAMRAAEPEVVFHLAAQALVATGWREPVRTFATNVMGTAHVLEAALAVPSVRAVVIVTSDKVYANAEADRPQTEADPLGGHEPYGASKAAAEIAVQAWRSRFAERGIGLGVARAGNVIGGGDWSAHRLVPDLVRALDSGRPVSLRHPGSVRPWQHVLEPLSGYLAYADRLLAAPAGLPPALNFGPRETAPVTVSAIADRFSSRFAGKPGWIHDGASVGAEAPVLKVDSALARRVLGWQARLGVDEAVDWTADWTAAWRAGQDMRAFTLAQITAYGARA